MGRWLRTRTARSETAQIEVCVYITRVLPITPLGLSSDRGATNRRVLPTGIRLASAVPTRESALEKFSSFTLEELKKMYDSEVVFGLH